MPVIRVVIHGPDTEQALAEMTSNIQYEKLDATVSVCREPEDTKMAINLNIPTKVETEADIVKIEIELARARDTLKAAQQLHVGDCFQYSGPCGSIWTVHATPSNGRVTLMCIETGTYGKSKVGELFYTDTALILAVNFSWKRVNVTAAPIK